MFLDLPVTPIDFEGKEDCSRPVRVIALGNFWNRVRVSFRWRVESSIINGEALCRLSWAGKLSLLPIQFVSVRILFGAASCQLISSELPRLCSSPTKSRMDCSGCFSKELDPALYHIYSAKVAISHGLKPSEHSNEVVSTRWVLVKELVFMSLVVRLLMEVVLLNCCLVKILRFPTFWRLSVDSREIMGSRLLFCNFARGSYFWRDGFDICQMSNPSRHVRMQGAPF